MRIVTWNMGYAFDGSAYRNQHDRAWRTLMELDPDIALLQETRPPSWVTEGDASVVGRSLTRTGKAQTAIWSKDRPMELLSFPAELDPLVGGQAVAVRTLDDEGQPLVAISMHAGTGSIPQEPFAALSPKVRAMLPSDRDIWHQDVLLAACRTLTTRRRFVAAGDLNIAWRMDALYRSGHAMAGTSDLFIRMRDAAWRRCHLKFHVGEEQTFFRPGQPGQMYQLDHMFADPRTYEASTRCDVLRIEGLAEMSDHAPMVLEVESGERAAMLASSA